MSAFDGPRSPRVDFVKIYFMMKDEHKHFFAESFGFHWVYRLPSLFSDIFYHIVADVLRGSDFGKKDKFRREVCILVWRELYSIFLARAFFYLSHQI